MLDYRIVSGPEIYGMAKMARGRELSIPVEMKTSSLERSLGIPLTFRGLPGPFNASWASSVARSPKVL